MHTKLSNNVGSVFFVAVTHCINDKHCHCVCTGVGYLWQHAGDIFQTVGATEETPVQQPPQLLTSCVHCSDNRWRHKQHTKRLRARVCMCVSPPLPHTSWSLLLSDCSGRLPRPPQWPPKGASESVLCHHTATHSELSWSVTSILLWNRGNNECMIHQELLQWRKPNGVFFFLGSYSDVLWEFASVENISQGDGEKNSSSARRIRGDIENSGVTGVLNPTVCLNLGNVILFTVDTRHYPQYDL